MMTCNATFYACCGSSIDAAAPVFPKPPSLICKEKPFAAKFPSTIPKLSISSLPCRPVLARALANSGRNNDVDTKKEVVEEEEVEEELHWIQDKALDLVDFTGSITQAITGPRVGGSSLPWIVAVPLASRPHIRQFPSLRSPGSSIPLEKNGANCSACDFLSFSLAI